MINVFNSFPIVWTLNDRNPGFAHDTLITYMYKVAFKSALRDVGKGEAGMGAADVTDQDSVNQTVAAAEAGADEAAPPPEKKPSWGERLKAGLAKTRNALNTPLGELFSRVTNIMIL